MVSPELALVDPELAREARKLLPDPGTTWWRDGREISSLAPAPIEPPAPPKSRLAAGVRAAAGLVAFAGLTAGVMLAVSSADGSSHEASPSAGLRTREEARQKTPAATQSTTTSPGSRVSPKREGSETTPSSTHPKDGPGSRTHPARKQTHPKGEPRSRKQPARTPDGGATREHKALPPLVWVPVSGAAAYRVELWRGGRKIFVARTHRPRLGLPRMWRYHGKGYRLSAGRYRWVVRPGAIRRGAVRYGRPTVLARLVIPRRPA